MKLLPLVVFCYLVTMACCTTKHSDPVPGKNNTGLADTTTEAVTVTDAAIDMKDEDFIAFLKRFHSDSIFRNQRICDVVHGFNSDDATFSDEEGGDVEISPEDYTWDKERIGAYLHFFDMAFMDSASPRDLWLKSDTVIKENLFIERTRSVSATFTLKKSESKWFLTELIF